MTNIHYETHKMPNRHLPFIFHPDFKRTPPESTTNWHENIELLHCISGSGYIRCGTRILPFHPGDLVVINADTLHSFGTDCELHYRCLIIDNSFFHANGVPIEQLFFQDRICDPQVLSSFEQIALAYQQLDTQEYLTVLQVRTCVLNLITALCREYTLTQPVNQSNDYVKRAITYLRQNFENPITLDQLADHVGISKYHLSRQFRLNTGSTVVKTLNAIRCSQALRLIGSGVTVSDAARSCGFENLSYFTRVFTQLYHKSPSHYITKP